MIFVPLPCNKVHPTIDNILLIQRGDLPTMAQEGHSPVLTFRSPVLLFIVQF